MAESEDVLVVAVSGGVDSVVLLDSLAHQTKNLIVAHIDHGIRADSHEDEALVRQLANEYGLPYETTQLKLGPTVSEERARIARYEWLDSVRVAHKAQAIVTAHHQDDVLETIAINLQRGTGWRGLCSLRETEQRHRPLLSWSKTDIVTYAISHSLQWREDSTNDNLTYTRNRIRHGVVPRFTTVQREKFLQLYEAQCRVRQQIEAEVLPVRKQFETGAGIARYWLIMAPDPVAYEILRSCLGESLEQARMRDLLLFAKTARNGAKWSLNSDRFVAMQNNRLIV